MQKLYGDHTHAQFLKMAAISGVFLTCMMSAGLRGRTPLPKARPWMNKALSPDKRADLVVQQLTLDEKIQLVHGAKSYYLIGDPNFSIVPGSLRGDGFVPAISRLGTPALQIIGSGVGVTDLGKRPNGQSTILPSSVAETATWDPKLAYEFGTVIGKETRNEGFNVQIGGAVNLTREPRNGRTFEYHGEDPLLAGTILGHEVKAIQDQHLVADIKHYAVNDQETGQEGSSSNLDKRALRESDLLAFEIALRESNAGVVMCAYNRVNGDWSCENDYLLNQVLKKDWGFKGWVMSDWGATHSTVKAALAGLDQEMFQGVYFDDALKRAVEKGKVPMSRLNDMAHRILRTAFACGIVDDPPVIRPIDVDAGRTVARRVEEAGIVLLKNAGNLLPLKASNLSRIALIGSYAETAVLSGGGSAQVNPVGGNAVPPDRADPARWYMPPVWVPTSPLKEMRIKAPNALVDYDPGGDPATVAQVSKAADVAIVFVHQWTHEDTDVPNLSLPGNQDQLVADVAGVNPHTVVVLETGGPVLMPWIDSVQVVLETWYPGGGGGEAIANVLFGDVNPSGKLPITFPKNESDLPHPVIAAPPPAPEVSNSTREGPVLFDVNYTEGVKVGYKWYDAENQEPLFPFGFGLSYTSFAYSQLVVNLRDGMQVSFNVKNTGSRAGAEAAQVYLGLPASADEPPKRLVAWEKVPLHPGETRRVSLTVNRQMMSIFNDSKDAWEVVPGEYTVYVGASSRDIRLKKALHISGELQSTLDPK